MRISETETRLILAAATTLFCCGSHSFTLGTSFERKNECHMGCAVALAFKPWLAHAQELSDMLLHARRCKPLVIVPADDEMADKTTWGRG